MSHFTPCWSCDFPNSNNWCTSCHIIWNLLFSWPHPTDSNFRNNIQEEILFPLGTYKAVLRPTYDTANWIYRSHSSNTLHYRFRFPVLLLLYSIPIPIIFLEIDHTGRGVLMGIYTICVLKVSFHQFLTQKKDLKVRKFWNQFRPRCF